MIGCLRNPKATAKIQEKEAEEKVRAAEKEQQKIEKEIKKKQCEKEKAEASLQRSIWQQHLAEEKARKALVKAAASNRNKTSKPEQKSYILILKLPQAVQAAQPAQPERSSQLEAAGVEGAQTRTRSGRQVQLNYARKKSELLNTHLIL